MSIIHYMAISLSNAGRATTHGRAHTRGYTVCGQFIVTNQPVVPAFGMWEESLHQHGEST